MGMEELYHVLNRGVDKRQIFMDDRDRARFVHDLWEFNDVQFVDNVRHRLPTLSSSRKNIPLSSTDFVSPYFAKERIVDLHGWCIMNNHYHLLISEKIDGGLTQFIRKLNIGYAKYFNERYERVGTLFQGRTKKILIRTDAHFLHILHYIHLNPLDYLQKAKSWRDGYIQSANKVLAYLSRYRWSSYLDYCKQSNFPSILTTELFADVFSNYEKRIAGYVKDLDTEVIGQYPLE